MDELMREIRDVEYGHLLVLAWVAGLAIPIGGVCAVISERFNARVRGELVHFSAALGAGALISAVALVLVPHGIKHFQTPWVVVLVMAGAVSFLLVDRWIAKQGNDRGQLLAMLLDFGPESIALGATFGAEAAGTVLLALLITLQNLPEGFNAYREWNRDQSRYDGPIGYFLALSLIGPVCAAFGLFYLHQHPTLLAGLMLFASGGILYLTFQDVAPEARYRGHWAPPLGAVIGFLAGVIGQMLLNG